MVIQYTTNDWVFQMIVLYASFFDCLVLLLASALGETCKLVEAALEHSARSVDTYPILISDT